MKFAFALLPLSPVFLIAGVHAFLVLEAIIMVGVVLMVAGLPFLGRWKAPRRRRAAAAPRGASS